MMNASRVAVAMSGGVDSSVAAALLKSEGHEVFGLMLRLWSPSEEIENRCCSPADMAIAKEVAGTLDIPFYTLDVKDLFKDTVVDVFIDGYAQGITPNPCLLCNRSIRWGFLLERARAMGASHMATGHYARLEKTGRKFTLLRALDRSKDQSYILSFLTQSQIVHTLFPLGDYMKDDVRQLAIKYGLPLADRGESQDLCFLGGMDYRSFLAAHLDRPPAPGPIRDKEGNWLGEHHGLSDFTIGQRKGIQISSPEPYYVLDKNVIGNELIVGTRTELGRKDFIVESCNWISGKRPKGKFQALTRIRYKSREVLGNLIPLGEHSLQVQLDQALPDITPGQAAVFYNDEVCLGGGIISQ